MSVPVDKGSRAACRTTKEESLHAQENRKERKKNKNKIKQTKNKDNIAQSQIQDGLEQGLRQIFHKHNRRKLS